MKKEDYLTMEYLEWFGFTRINDSDLEWDHPYLLPKNLFLSDFDGAYHFMLRGNTYQGIGRMQTVDDLEIGFKFVTGLDIYSCFKNIKR